MKKRAAPARSNHGPEFKGVVKKLTGRVTNNPKLEEEGRTEMLGNKPDSRRHISEQDPHRRG
ncbi:MAG TPA: hypothetical protein VK846_04675 [Candidatus Limnocylindria bacterium]|nr:hypothetical protein [Candidatus Limnocylindria bacterium]